MSSAKTFCVVVAAGLMSSCLSYVLFLFTDLHRVWCMFLSPLFVLPWVFLFAPVLSQRVWAGIPSVCLGFVTITIVLECISLSGCGAFAVAVIAMFPVCVLFGYIQLRLEDRDKRNNPYFQNTGE